MKALLAVVLFAGVAQAAPITPPAGWTLDPSLAPPPAAQRFGGATTKVSVYAYRAPAPGAVLYVNRAEAEVTTDRDRIATIELEEPRNAMRRQGANAKAEQDSTRFDAAAKQLEGVVTWRDATVGVLDASRVIVAGDDKRLVAVSGQCVLALDAPPEVAAACNGALATLDTEVPPATRVALSIAQTVAEPPPKPAHDSMDDGGKLSLPAIRIDQSAPEPDRRPVYVGGGIIVLAAVFWWNRKRREKFEDDHPAEEVRDVPTATARKRDKSTDEDADDLHAAAEAGDDGDRT